MTAERVAWVVSVQQHTSVARVIESPIPAIRLGSGAADATGVQARTATTTTMNALSRTFIANLPPLDALR
jgi:hypothetical protein